MLEVLNDWMPQLWSRMTGILALSLAGKMAVVTGSRHGIGRAIALAMSQAGESTVQARELRLAGGNSEWSISLS